MTVRNPLILRIVPALLLVCALTAPAALAQSNQRSGDRDQDRQSQQSQKDQQSKQDRQAKQDRQSKQDREAQARQQQQSRQGTLVIGYDLNRDGWTDVYQVISPVEFDRLQREHQRQQQRAQRGQAQQQDQRQAQMQRQSQQRQSQQRQWQARMQDEQRPPVVLSGTVEDTKKIAIKGQRDKHNLVLLQMQDGRRRVVNLGPKKTLSDLNLRRGDEVQVRGRRGTINGRGVLMAEAVRADGEVTRISRQAGQRFSADQPIQGRIIDTYEVQLRGQDQPHQLVKIRKQDGKACIVNLGPDKKLSDFNLQQGDRVTIQGRPARINDRLVILAERVNQRTAGQWMQQGDVFATPRRDAQQRRQQQRGNQQDRGYDYGTQRDRNYNYGDESDYRYETDR